MDINHPDAKTTATSATNVVALHCPSQLSGGQQQRVAIARDERESTSLSLSR